jgi:hypothetical protein
MNRMLRAALVAVSFASIGPAYAGRGEGTVADTRLAEIPGEAAQSPAQNTPQVAAARNASASHSNGVWLFPPIGKYLAQ